MRLISAFLLVLCGAISTDAANLDSNVQAAFGSDSSSTCHSIKAFQDGINLGDVYYAGVSVPLDIRQPVVNADLNIWGITVGPSGGAEAAIKLGWQKFTPPWTPLFKRRKCK